MGKRVVQSFVVSGVMMYTLWRGCPERWQDALLWSLPLFHRMFPPWTSGPNAYAAICALAVDFCVLTGVAFALLGCCFGRVRR